jgi:YebC/PmpR family DNA-binding regulatory protein
MGRAFEVRKAAMAKTSAAKSKVYSKYGREIYLAAKSGVADPEINVNLKRMIEKAKKDQVPADIIKRAIEKAKGGVEDNLTSVRYEGFGPEGSMFIVECLTDNVNRTVSEVRNCFTKTGGKLGVSGSVLHQFNHQAIFAVSNKTEDEIFEVLVLNDINVSDIESDEDGVSIYGEAQDFNSIKTALLDAMPDIEFETDEIMWVPITEVKLTQEESFKAFEKLQNMLDELDDVQDIYHNIIE